MKYIFIIITFFYFGTYNLYSSNSYAYANNQIVYGNRSELPQLIEELSFEKCSGEFINNEIEQYFRNSRVNSIFLFGIDTVDIDFILTKLNNLGHIFLRGTNIKINERPNKTLECLTVNSFGTNIDVPVLTRLISKFNNLNVLSLIVAQSNSDFLIDSLFTSIYKNDSLKWLNIHMENSYAINKNILKLNQLEKLALSSSGELLIQDDIDSLKKLKSLSIACCDTCSPNALLKTVSQLKDLEKLSISFNSMSSLPDCLTNLTRLKELNIDKSVIEFLPERISHLKDLEIFNIENSLLTSLPDGFKLLKNLKRCRLGNNKISDKRMKEIIKSMLWCTFDDSTHFNSN